MDKHSVQKIWHDHECAVADLRKHFHNDYNELFTDYKCSGYYLAGKGLVWS